MNTTTISPKTTKISASKTERKIIEKNRRNQMKCLYSQLNSLVHQNASSSSSKETLALPEQIDEATEYIKKMEKHLEDLKKTKDSFESVGGNNNKVTNNNNDNNNKRISNKRSYSLKSPVQIEVHEKGNDVEVILVTGLECQFVFTEAIRIVNEEFAEVVNASYSVVGSTVFHSIHAKIGENATTQGVARISERLKKFAL